MIKLALLQMNVESEKEENILKAERMVRSAASRQADIVVLPEMFNCPYNAANFPLYAEPDNGPAWQALSHIAADNKIFLVAGSIPEKDSEGHVYNTCYIFDADGTQIGKHRKIHLFDIHIPGKQTFRESDTLTPGSAVTVVDTPFCPIGIAICYDIRFPELFRMMVDRGAKLVIVPGAFNMTTGPAHWEILFRTRAMDNQVYMAGAAPARNSDAGYVSYANSLVATPWGDIAGRLGEKEETLFTEIDITEVDRVRRELPLLEHRRKDIYF